MFRSWLLLVALGAGIAFTSTAKAGGGSQIQYFTYGYPGNYPYPAQATYFRGGFYRPATVSPFLGYPNAYPPSFYGAGYRGYGYPGYASRPIGW